MNYIYMTNLIVGVVLFLSYIRDQIISFLIYSGTFFVSIILLTSSAWKNAKKKLTNTVNVNKIELQEKKRFHGSSDNIPQKSFLQ